MLERQDRVNFSTLKHMLKSPKHYLWALTHPREDSEAMLLGRLTHALVYEADQVASRYVREPRFNRAMLDATAISRGYEGGKETAAAWTLTNAGRDIVPVDLWDRAVAMGAALQSDPISGPMIRGGFAEQMIEWTDKRTGIECRGRVDHINGALSDLKSTRDIQRFAAQATSMAYGMQIAYYADGLAANGIALVESPAFVVVENVPPFDVVVLEIDDAALSAGRRLYRSCLDRLAECRATDSWPGVSGGARALFVPPAWAVEADEPELTMSGEAIAF